MGKRTSVYLSDEIAAAVKASGISLAEHVARSVGLSAAPAAEPAIAPRAAVRPADCAHRGLGPGAWCKSCQSAVPEHRGKS